MGLYDAAFIVGIVEYEQCGGVCGVGHYAPLGWILGLSCKVGCIRAI